ncbi:hypothetical protein PV327_003817 [Microctonus hyperodae]|uniref:Uncharacterized protein n=1 Tax=Microctonus hyperodae TaxID=165561 RepID=A0AA39L1G0_MICHY|nr:hypothetical protein PV327_003817 [Microctonus hyperodae]
MTHKNNGNKNSDGSISFRSSCSTNSLNYFDAEHGLIKYSTPKNSLKKKIDNESRIFYSKAQKSKNSHDHYINKNNNSYDKNLQVVIRDNNNRKIYHMINLPCDYLHLIHHIIQLINSSSTNLNTDELHDEFIATLNDTCTIINKKLNHLDSGTIKRCRLYCSKQNNIISIKLKMMNVDGSKIILYQDEINHVNNQRKILKPEKKFKSNKYSLNKAVPIIDINSKIIVANQFDDVHNKINNSTSDQPSSGSINEYPVENLNPKKYKAGKSAQSNDYNNPNDDDTDDNSFENNCIECDCSCSCSLHNFCNHEESCDSECSCELSVEIKEEESTEKEIAVDNKLSLSSVENFQHEETQTNEINLFKKESNDSEIIRQLMDENIERVIHANANVDSISTQTSEWSELSSSNISVVISDVMKNREVDEMQRIEEEEEEEEEVNEVEEEIEGIKEFGIVEKYDENIDMEIEESDEIELIKEDELENVKKINEDISVDDNVVEFVNNIIIKLIDKLNLPLYVSSSSLKSRSGDDSSVSVIEKAEEIVTPECDSEILKQSELIIKENLIHSKNKEDHRKSSTVILCPCNRPFEKLNSTSAVIKYSKKYSDNLSSGISRSKSFSNVKAQYGHANLFATGDSSMNNFYSVRPHKRRLKICYCKNNRAIKSNSKIRLVKRKINHYASVTSKNTKSIMSALYKRLKIIFSRKTYRKLKKLIKEKRKDIKLLMEREKLKKESKINCGRQCKRQQLNGINYSSKNLNKSQHDKNYLNKHDKLNHHNHSSLSKKYQSPNQEKSSQNYKKISTIHKNEFINSHQRKQLSIPNMKHHEVYNKLINNINQQCHCPCCCASFQTINYYKSTNNSIIKIDNQRCKFLPSNYKQIKSQESHEFSNNKKSLNTTFSALSSSSSLSLSSRKNYFCCYHKMFAAKKLNEHALNSHFVIHKSVSGELNVDCGECFGPDDHDFRLMLNQYINICKHIKCPIINPQQTIIRNSSKTISHHK